MFNSFQNRRIKEIFIVVLLLFFFVFVKVFYVQVIEYEKLSSLANDLWSRNLPIGSDRGDILDRNGKVIVSNITTSSLIVVPSQIVDKKMVAKSLSEILDVDYDDMLSHVSKKTSIERIHPEGRDLSYEVSDEINDLGYDGVYLVKESKREYLYPELLSHVIGYVGIDNVGLSGLELMYNDVLSGTDGSIQYFSDGKGRRLEMSEVYNSPSNGDDVYLTIDLDIQLSLSNELDIAMNKYNADGAMGIVMNPKTGEILAMESKPGFDASNYQDYSEEVINRNLAIWSNFEPGSTFKILTLAAAVNEGVVNIFEDTYNDTGKINVSGTTLHCWKNGGHGLQTYLEVVENSCNPGFVTLGQKLGTTTLFDYIDKLGFGSKTGVDLNGESSGIIFDIDNVGPLELATTSFGQGVSVTAIQQVQAVSAIVNNGTMMQPYIVKQIDEDIIESVIKKENLISSESSSLVRYALESVVANGSGRNAYIENYRIGGKTGTAQKVGSDGLYMVNNYILSFIGFMPADDPEYVVYIAVDNAKGVTQYGGTVAAPIAGNVFDSIINFYDLEEDYEGLPREYLYYEEKYVTVPNVVGLSKSDAIKTLKGFEILYTGTGDNVILQAPLANAKIKEGGQVKIMLN